MDFYRLALCPARAANAARAGAFGGPGAEPPALCWRRDES